MVFHGGIGLKKASEASVIPYDPSIGGGKVERQPAYLPWKTNGLEHGIRPHLVRENGEIVEMLDLRVKERKKPKHVSSRQWGRC